MPVRSPATSSPKSKPAARHAKAAASAKNAFAYSPSLPHEATAESSPDRAGKTRLAGAFLIALDRMDPDPNQPRKRIAPQHLQELTASIKRLGVIQPITVRYVKETDTYRIIGGECRYTAAKKAGLKDIPCWVRTPKENDVLLEQIIENWQRSDLNPVDLAESLGILKEANGYNQAELSSVTGKSKGEISKVLSILNLDPEVRRTAREDGSASLTKRHLYSLSQLPVPLQTSVLHKIQQQNLTAADTERLAERMRRQEESGDRRGTRVFRRAFKVSRGTVTLTFHSNTISDDDVLQALHEVRRQLGQE